MKMEGIRNIAVITGNDAIANADALLDLAMSARYETGADRLAIEKSMLANDFFILSTRFAGEALQKLINYRFKIAVFGDYSHYTSKPLKDFMRESNRRRDVFLSRREKKRLKKPNKTGEGRMQIPSPALRYAPLFFRFSLSR